MEYLIMRNRYCSLIVNKDRSDFLLLKIKITQFFPQPQGFINSSSWNNKLWSSTGLSYYLLFLWTPYPRLKQYPKVFPLQPKIVLSIHTTVR